MPAVFARKFILKNKHAIDEAISAENNADKRFLLRGLLHVYRVYFLY
jgi:hypothetical protein